MKKMLLSVSTILVLNSISSTSYAQNNSYDDCLEFTHARDEQKTARWQQTFSRFAFYGDTLYLHGMLCHVKIDCFDNVVRSGAGPAVGIEYINQKYCTVFFHDFFIAQQPTGWWKRYKRNLYVED